MQFPASDSDGSLLMIIKPFSFALATILLAGCSITPGMMFNDSRFEKSTEGGTDGSDDNAVKFRLTQITPQLLNKIQAQQQVQAKESSAIQQFKQEIESYEYRVGPQDVLSIIVWDHPELTIPMGEFRNTVDAGTLVDRDGVIFYPYVGVIEVAGKTVSEIREILTQRIARYVTNPQLDVRVAAFRSQRVNVVGEVVKPSILPISDIPLTVLEAVNLAGGATIESDLGRVLLTRGKQEQILDIQALYDKGDLSQNRVLRDGDVLHIPDRNNNKIYVLGEVEKPAAYLMHKGKMNLAEAIGHSRGFDRTSSDPGRLFVIRGEQNEPIVYHLNAASPDALLLATQFELAPQDVVYVSSTSLARWNRVMVQILPTIQGLWQTKVLVE